MDILSIDSYLSANILIMWENMNEIESYEVYRCDSIEGNFDKIAEVPGIDFSYIDRDVSFGERYYYKVRAKKIESTNNIYSLFSEIVPGQIMKMRIINIELELEDHEDITNCYSVVSFETIAYAQSYSIYYKKPSDTSYNKFSIPAVTDVKEQTVRVPTEFSMEYQFVVVVGYMYESRNVIGPYSEIVTFSTSLGKPEVLIKESTRLLVTLQWLPLKNARGYQVYRKDYNSEDGEMLVATLSEEDILTDGYCIYNDETVEEGMYYGYRILGVYTTTNTITQSSYSEYVFTTIGELSTPLPTFEPTGEPTRQPTEQPDKQPTEILLTTPLVTTQPNDVQSTNRIVVKQGKPITTFTVGKVKYKVTKYQEDFSVSFVSTKSSSKSIVIPSTVKYKGIKYKVTGISNDAFKNNKKIKSIIIGENITSIGKSAFYGAKNLKFINIKSKHLNKVSNYAIRGINGKAIIKCKNGKNKAIRKLFIAKTGYNKSMRIIT